MSIRSEMRQKELEYAKEKKVAFEKSEKIKEKRARFQEGYNEALLEKKKFIKNKYGTTHFSSRRRPDKEDFLSINSGELMVETAGYIPVSEQVRRFERAGLTLQESMGEIYDFGATDIDRAGS